MSKILVENKYCKILEEDDKDFLSKLNKKLSFMYEGAKYSPAYRNHWWDGMEFLLSKKLEFYSGLLNIVIDFYKLHNKELELIYNIPKISENHPIDITDNLKKLNIEPYDYQLNSVNEALKNNRIIYSHATGAGKSATIALITAAMGKSTAIYVISKELLYQFHSFFSKLFDQEIGIIGDGVCKICPISIVSVWTLGRALGMKKKDIIISDDNYDEKYNENDAVKIIDYIKTVKIHHFDECHICSSTSVKNIYKVINPEALYGWSGTPIRDDGSNLVLTGILGDRIHKVSASELIKRGILAKPLIKFVPIKGYFKYDTAYPTIYSEHIINNNYRNNTIISETKKLLDKNYKVLVLFKIIKHGNLLYKLFKDNDIDCEFLNGNDTTKKRQEVKEKLLSGESNCILASQIYDIGIDIKTLNALILGGGGKSSVKTMQRIGRVIRDGKSKPFAAVVDFYDDVKFLKGHSRIRKEIYSTEEEFVIKWPEDKKK